jgi:sugar O-acyltransferase (sialic acid O-acetyltransferase NeuD family)
MLIYGASGHSKVIIDALELHGDSNIKLFDDDLRKVNLLGFDVIGIYDEEMYPNESIIIGIGNNHIRKQVSSIINHSFGKLIHPNSEISKYSEIGLGSVVFSGAIIQANAKIGEHCIVNTNASVDHDCIIENFVHIGPNVALCGGVTVGEGTLIGVGAAVIPGIKIGKWATIGAGSVVINDVPDFAKVVGNPANRI